MADHQPVDVALVSARLVAWAVDVAEELAVELGEAANVGRVQNYLDVCWQAGGWLHAAILLDWLVSNDVQDFP
jgi:hypothetical protein